MLAAVDHDARRLVVTRDLNSTHFHLLTLHITLS